MSGIVDYLNNFGQQISAALGSQQAATQASIDAQQRNLADFASQIQSQQASGFGSVLPEFSSFYQGVAQSLPPQLQQIAPQLQLGGGNLVAGLSKVTTRTLTPNGPTRQNYLGGKSALTPKTLSSFNRLSGISSVGGKVNVPSPSTGNAGGSGFRSPLSFGGSSQVTKLTRIAK